MTKIPAWRSIAEALRADIASGHFDEAGKLPTEAELSKRFDVNRHTVRRALAQLIEEQIVISRRGAGVFIRHKPIDYPIGARPRFHQNLQAAGRLPNRKTLRLQKLPAGAEQSKALGLPLGETILLYEGLSFSGDTPVAYFKSYFPLSKLPGIDATFLEETSITKALKKHGIEDYLRVQTRITAERTAPEVSRHLVMREGEPALQTESINTTLDGTPIEFGITQFASDRIALTISPDASEQGLSLSKP